MTKTQMSRRRWLAAGSTGLGAVALAACGAADGQAGGQSTAGKGKAVLMTQGSDINDENRYKPIVDEYNARKGPVTIEMMQGGGGATDQQAKLITLIVSGSPPDVFWTHANISPTMVKLNLVAPFDTYIKNDKDFKLTNYFESALKNYEAGGKQYGIPREATAMVMVVNKELFQKNGVGLPTDNWTWDDFLKAAQAMSKPSANQTWGTSQWGGKLSMAYYPYVKVWSEGGDLLDATRTKFTLHQSPGVDQIQWLADLMHKFKVAPTTDEYPGATLKEAWATGRIGMVPSIPVITDYKDATFDWDYYPLPRGSKGRVTRSASAGHSMTAASKNKDAAWEVIKFLGSKSTFEHWAKIGLTIPAHKEVATGPLVLNPSLPPKSAKVAQDAFAYARPEPITGDWGSVSGEISKALATVFAGTTTAGAALTAIVPVVESFLNKSPAMAAVPTPTAVPR